MNYEQISKLLDAGFTKDEIMQLARDEPLQKPGPEPEPLQKPGPEPEPQPGPEPEPEKKTAPEPKPQPEPDSQIGDRLTSIEKSISDLMKAFQSENLKKDQIRTTAHTLEEQTDAIMASIIRPETGRKDQT